MSQEKKSCEHDVGSGWRELQSGLACFKIDCPACPFCPKESSPKCERGCTYSRAMGQPRPRKCIVCGKPEFIDQAKEEERILKDIPGSMLMAVKLAYRVLHLGDDRVTDREASDACLNALCNEMGDEGYQRWLRIITKGINSGYK